MAIDIAAKLAQLRAAREEAAKKNKNEDTVKTTDTTIVIVAAIKNDSVDTSLAVTNPVVPVKVTETAIVGTAKTSEIDHIEFLSKMNSLREAIHTQHPTMPVLLMQIHKQLRADPELVTTLDEDAIGVIVKGLQIQTKTELMQVIIKESKTKAKKIPLSADMF